MKVCDVGTVRLNGERMAKSTGNLVLVDELLQTWSPALLRLALIDRPVAEPWDFDALDRDAVATRLDALYVAAARTSPSDPEPVLARLRTDLDVSGAVDLAIDAGGDAARKLIAVLDLA